jgi:hypothetical protein
MEATTTSKTEIRPFTVEVSDEELTDLRNRIEATRWPDRGVDPSQGVQLETIQPLADYWASDYDWRKLTAPSRSPSSTPGPRHTPSPSSDQKLLCDQGAEI